MPVEDIFEDDDWEDQADKLYEWTQNLSLDELGDTSPWKPSLTILQQNSLKSIRVQVEVLVSGMVSSPLFWFP